ncbi:MAG: glycosyltransferase WbuB [Planctomycetota bacterium]|nr:MAG: glycosyltransferase WbuB [Planctomycetota bacterium]
MRLLLLTLFFEPDLCPGSFRATALAKALCEVDSSIEIDVLTTLPHRYSSYCADAPLTEKWDRINIHRIELPAHKNRMFDQSISFWSFSRQVRTFIKGKHYDLIFATSSRLMTSVLGAWVASRSKAPLYLDIRDIFVDTIKDVLPKYSGFLAKPFFASLESWSIKRARKVNLVSKGFASYFEDRYPMHKFSYFTNGIDDDFLNFQSQAKQETNSNLPIRIVYAGNIGEGQGLHLILPQLSKRLEGRVNFVVIGDGSRKKLLKEHLKSIGASNVQLMAPMSRELLLEEYKKADVLFLHLNKYAAFEKVLPSKIFEYAATGKPIWAGIPGFSAKFVLSEINNAVVFPPCDEIAAEIALDSLIIQDSPRVDFVEKFSRINICKELAKDILSLI